MSLKDKQTQEFDVNQAIDKAKGFWEKNSRLVIYVGSFVILAAGGWYIYRNWVVKPKNEKAGEAISRAQDYFQQDSLDLALNGDGANFGFLKIISRYGGTDASNLAHYYAGAIYLRKLDFPNAIKYLKKFSTSATQIQSAAWRMLGDALMESGKKEEGISYYKKAGTLNEKDEYTSSENLYRAALALETLGKNNEALEIFQTIKEKYPKTDAGFKADKYIGKLGAIK